MSKPLSAHELLQVHAWPSAHLQGRPFVVYKFAASLDGRIAAADGTSRWISSVESRDEVQVLRSHCDATIVGSGTQLADNPSLAVRDVADPRLDRRRLERARQPLRVIVDSHARTPDHAQVLDGSAPTLIAVAQDADPGRLAVRATVLPLPRSDGGLDLAPLLAALFQRGVRAVLLEGGPTLAGAFVAARLVDHVIAYLAPTLLGAGPCALGAAGITTIADKLPLQVLHCGRSGEDVRLLARVRF